VKTYRDRARSLFGITEPEMIMPTTAHPGLEKAATYFCVKTVRTPIRGDYKADVDAMRKAINKNTILLVASAPQYPHGIVDPIEEIGSLALQNDLPLHIDACIGGFMLTWARKLGYEVPNFDFSVPGVTSISTDIHKYGFGTKGASVLLFKNSDIRKYQYFIYLKWPGGILVSPTMQGTRGGGTIAAAWAALTSIGESGYLKYAKLIMDTTKYLQKEISLIPGLFVLGKPHMSITAFSSKEFNIYAVADVMETKFGWKIEKQQNPDCIHVTVMPPHARTKEKFIMDLKKSIEDVKMHPKENYSSAALYGLIGKIPSTDLVEDFLLTFMDKVYS